MKSSALEESCSYSLARGRNKQAAWKWSRCIGKAAFAGEGSYYWNAAKWNGGSGWRVGVEFSWIAFYFRLNPSENISKAFS